MSKFNEVTDLWKEEKRMYVKISTYAIYSQLLSSYITPYFGDKDELSEACIQDFVNDLLGRGLALKTVKDILLIVKMIVRYGVKIKSWPDISMDVHFPTKADTRKDLAVLSKPHLQKLVNFLRKNFSFENLGIYICLHSGLRIGEVCGLQWKDLDTSAGVINVNKTVQRIFISDDEQDIHKNYLSIDSPKSVSSLREIPISGELMKLIRPLKRVVNEDYYVVSNASMPMEPRRYREYYRRLLKELNIPHIRFHALRHSFATRCIESKCDYKTVSVLLGHSSISTTMDLYVHPGYDEKKRCIERLSKVLG